jgi:hypothetical protein
VPSGDYILCDLTESEAFQAYFDCRKGKKNTLSVQKFEEHLNRNVMDLYYDLINNTYEPGMSICFVVTKPKAREIWAASFRDRIVHHILYNRYSDQFHKSFIHDSYACIPNKGTLKASIKVQKNIRSVTKNHTQQASFLKADIVNFFVSINKNILEEILSKKITDPWWFNLTKIILHNDPTKNCFIKSNEELLNKVPKHKSLFNAKKGFGLPIGNLSSQFFANVYLNELDQYIKHELKVKYYIRYVDDILLMGESGKDLEWIYRKIEIYTFNKLGLDFHPNKLEINTVDMGINFVGYIIKPFCKYIRRTTIENLHSKLCSNNLKQVVNSYFGMLIHCNQFKERVHIKSLLNVRFDKNLTKIIGI